MLILDLHRAYECIEWNAVDISTVYNISDFEPDIIKQVAILYMHVAVHYIIQHSDLK